MSQVNNKVQWCLKKAEKEVAEKGFHRGLIKSSEDVLIAKQHLIKAEHNLKAAIYFDKGYFSDWSISAFFYTIYHCFLAIARRFGYESRNQECTVALIEMLKEEGKIDLDQEFIDTLKIANVDDMHKNNVISLRESFQYNINTEFKDREKFEKLLKLCQKVIDETTNIIIK